MPQEGSPFAVHFVEAGVVAAGAAVAVGRIGELAGFDTADVVAGFDIDCRLC
jgi:hypothetical protein